MATTYTPASIVGQFDSAKLGTELQNIKNDLDRKLSRENDGPNAMNTPIDMGEERIVNVGPPVDPYDAVRLIDLQAVVNSSFFGDSAAALKVEFASTAANVGASLIGVQDVQNKFTATNVETVLTEIAIDIDSIAVTASNAAAAATAAAASADAAAASAGALQTASQAEAEAGAINTKMMTPLRTLQAIVAKVITDDMGGLFLGEVVNGDYRIVIKLAYGLTITETTTRSGAGTATMTFKINSTALGGTANAASTSEQSQVHASANVAAAGDDLVITVSSASGLEDVSFGIKFTRAIG